MTAVRWLFAVPAAILFALCILGNWSLFIAGIFSLLRSREVGSFSLVLPFLGPVFGIVFFLAVPLEGFAQRWWLAILFEPTWLIAAGLLLSQPFVNLSDTPE